MDDLIPFIVFVVIALINLVKSWIERGMRKKRSVQAVPQERSAQSSKNTLEELLDQLTTPLEEQEEIYEEKEIQSPIPITPEIINKEEEQLFQNTSYKEQTSDIHKQTIHSALKSMPSTLLSLNALKIHEVPMRNSTHRNSLYYPLKNKKTLKEAIIANIVFNQPRAYDTSFDNCNI